MRCLGHELANYIEDIWVVGKTENSTEDTVFLLIAIGFVTNKKSLFVPTTIEWISRCNIIDARQMIVSLTKKKVDNLRRMGNIGKQTKTHVLLMQSCHLKAID